MSETFNQKPSLADCYRTLGLAPGAPESEVKAAFRKLSLKHHPDRAGGTPANNAKFSAIRQAFEDILDYLAEPKQGRWAEPPLGGAGRGGGFSGYEGGHSRGGGFSGYRGYGGRGYPGSPPPPGYGSGTGRPSGRSYFPTDDPDFGDFFDAASEFMFGEKGMFPGSGGSSGSRGPRSSRDFPSGGFSSGAGGFSPGYGRSSSSSSSSGMPPRGFGDFSPFGGGYQRDGGRYGTWEPFSGRGGSSSGKTPYSSGFGEGGGDEGEAAPPREDKLGVIQWSLRRAHRRLAPLPGKLYNMRRWWDKVDECGDLTPKQRALGRERFDRAEVHLAKMLSQATEQMEAVRNRQEKSKDKKEKKKNSKWYDNLGKKKSKGEKQSTTTEKKIDKWTMTAMQLGRDSEAVLNEVVALEQCAKQDDLDEFLAALGDIKSGGGSGKKQDEEESSSEDSSSEEESSDADSGSESG
ncbi:hypothetical protein PG993_002299 [Apiospora rasikravindrae]|uniref:J domain-containing protein n=1 Tax=Apiospora rasikravindrae TaxID=990691 RepID=A0ABR1TZ07_9PEZI